MITLVTAMRYLVLLAVVMLAGCGSGQPLGQVTGTVTLDGQPLGNVLVIFAPSRGSESQSSRSVGISDAAGKFELKTEDGSLGALVGAHRVVVEDLAVADAPRDDEGSILAMPPNRVPERYRSALTTTATADVKSGSQQVAVELYSTP